MLLIGVDCATQPNKVGLAKGHLEGEKLLIEFAKCLQSWAAIDDQISQWIKEEGNCLLALDAPLGWPEPLGETLVPHKAGAALPESVDRDRMFYRETDRWIHGNIGKKPLAVGADKIACTAYAALSFLERLRDKTGHKIPLAWEHKDVGKGKVAAIEVYPAATLKVCGLPHTGYKNKESAEEKRKKIIEGLKEKMTLSGPEDVEKEMLANDDVLDAVVCVLAAADFARKDACPPENRELAKKEGWIWVRKPASPS